MQKIHVMIAEDELMARKELTYLLTEEEDVELCPSAESGEQLLQLYREYEPDVIFLDIHMPGISGLEAAQQLIDQAVHVPPLFIFTTAYDEYAIKAFDLEAVDYLLKPFDELRFQKAMKRLRNQIKQRERKLMEPYVSNSTSTGPAKLLIDDGERTVVLSPDMIYFAMPHKRMLEIHTKDRAILSRMTLQELEKKLVGHPFFRTHRSYLVNLNYIKEITPWFNGTSNITLKDIEHIQIPVSRTARKMLFKMFENNH
ncbi:LytR/AlgR family response regulator transcription factor [Bacillus rubiinfantis]|uniref:LytR/AlgR family response regulator transcription factor n=1 Tax=Bacillus rubiinfantis TaxID=1499680 RepID=UPI0005A639FD|nr:LytTR family DNA-binding domain-containing protein [Bacillus rubiinfantis]